MSKIAITNDVPVQRALATLVLTVVLAALQACSASTAQTESRSILPEVLNLPPIQGSQIVQGCVAPGSGERISPPGGDCVISSEQGALAALRFHQAYTQALTEAGWQPECAERELTLIFARRANGGEAERLRVHTGWDRWDERAQDYDTASRGMIIFAPTDEDICFEVRNRQ